MARITKAEKNKRVNEVYSLLIAGARRQEILEYASKWDVKRAQVDNYIADANARFEEVSQTIREQELGKSIDRLNHLFQKLLRIQDYKGALQVQKEMNTLLGLHSPARHEHTGADGSELTVKVIYEDALASDD